MTFALSLPQRWVDYNFYGHQLVCHLVDGYNASSSANAVDGDPVPVPHFGLAMTAEAFAELAERVASRGIVFELEPHVRFKGAPGEQRTMFFRDPSGNALEFKASLRGNLRRDHIARFRYLPTLTTRRLI